MRVNIIAIGQKMPAWAQSAYADYAKRMPPEWKFDCKALKATPRSSLSNTAHVMQTEGLRIQDALAGMGKQSYTIVLDEHGKGLTTYALAKVLKECQDGGSDVAFVIGGADGLDPAIKGKAQLLMRISDMTLPHAMVRVLLTEQIYRAWSVLANHPYHRE